MAVRKPLYYNSGVLQEMSTAMVDQIIDQIIYQYSLNPSVSLTRVSSGGSLGTINDTRLQAGAASTNASSFPSESTTAEPSVVTVSYDKITETRASVSPTTDTGKTWPVYYTSGGNVQAMNLTDVKDTFLHPAIDLLTAGTTTAQQAGTYHIETSSNVTGSTAVSTNVVYRDTRADTSLYTASGITETLDQPKTINEYYLHVVNGSDNTFVEPIFIDANDNLKEYLETDFESLMQEWIRYTAVSSSDGYSISYNLGSSGSGNTRGSGMADTRLNGSGNYKTRQINTNDYRAQEFPNGTATTIATYYLRINKS